MKMFKKLTPSLRDDAEGKMQAVATAIFEILDEVKHLRAENESLMALSKLGRWSLDQAKNITLSKFSIHSANAIDAKATELGLGYMEDMGTYEVFIETDKAKVLDNDP